MPEGLWMEVHNSTGGSDQNHLQEKEMQKGKMVIKEALQIAEKRREVKLKGEKKRYTHLNAKFQRMARRDKKVFFSDQCREIEERLEIRERERLEISSRKLEIPR